MRKNGVGRSNAFPILQLVLGAAMIVIGLLDALRLRSDAWVGWVLAAAGAMQILSGAMTIRRNQRIDRIESEQ